MGNEISLVTNRQVAPLDFSEESQADLFPSNDYKRGLTLLENRTPREIFREIKINERNFFGTPIFPEPGYVYIVKEQSKPLKFFSFGEEEYIVKKYSKERIYAVYSGLVNHNMVFSSASRVENTGTSSSVAMTYKVSDLTRALSSGALDLGFLRPVVLELTNQFLHLRQDKKRLRSIAEFSPDDEREILSKLREELSSYMDPSGLSLKRIHFDLIKPEYVQRSWRADVLEEILDSEKKVNELMYEFQAHREELERRKKRRERLASISDRFEDSRLRRTEELQENLHQMELESRIYEHDLEIKRRESQFFFERLRGELEIKMGYQQSSSELLTHLRNSFSHLESSLATQNNPLSIAVINSYLQSLVNTLSDGRITSEYQASQRMTEEILDLELENMQKTKDVKKIEAMREIVSEIGNSIIGITGQLTSRK